MALHENQTSCRECGAPVHSIGRPYCVACADASQDEEEDDRPTVIAPSFGAFARQNTDESLEHPLPRRKRSLSLSPMVHDPDTNQAQVNRPLVVGLLLAIAAVAAGIVFLF